MVAHAGTARKAEISTRSPRPTGTQRVLPSPVDPACRETAKLKYSHVQPLVALKYKIQPSQFLKTTVTARPLHQSGGRVKCTVARNKTHILPANRHQSNLTVTRDTKPHALKLPRVKRSNVECAHGAYALTRATRCGPRSLCYSSERFSEVSLSNPPRPPPQPNSPSPHPPIHPPNAAVPASHPCLMRPARPPHRPLPTRPSPLAPPAQRSAPKVERLQSGGGCCLGVSRVAKGRDRPNEPIELALPSSGHVVYSPAPCRPWLGLG